MTKGSDVYSFGVLLWSLWAGQHPFVGEDGIHLPNKRFPTFNRTPTSDASASYAQYKTLAEACLRKSPHERPTFAQVKESLLAIFGGPAAPDDASGAETKADGGGGGGGPPHPAPPELRVVVAEAVSNE